MSIVIGGLRSANWPRILIGAPILHVDHQLSPTDFIRGPFYVSIEADLRGQASLGVYVIIGHIHTLN